MLRRARNQGGEGLPPIHDAATVDGVVVLDLAWGRCSVTAAPDALVLVAEAATVEDLERIQDGVGGRVSRIGRRDGLSVKWSPVESDASVTAVRGSSSRHGSLVGGAAFVVVLGAVVVVHLGLGAALLRGHWTWWVLLALGVVLVGKLLVARHFTAGIRGHLPSRRR